MIELGVDLRRALELLREPITVEKATEYQRLAAISGDPWQAIRGLQLRGRAAINAANPEDAVSAFERALALCGDLTFPDVCIETKLWFARFYVERFRIQQAFAGRSREEG